MYKKNTVVLVPFPFTDLSANKIRPALILSNNLKGDDVVVCFISSNKNSKQETDISIKKTDKNFIKTGLKTDSVIKVSKIATLDKKIILGELGGIDTSLEDKINKNIKIIFDL